MKIRKIASDSPTRQSPAVQQPSINKEAIVDWMLNSAENETDVPDYVEYGILWGCTEEKARNIGEAFYNSGIMTEMNFARKQERCEALAETMAS